MAKLDRLEANCVAKFVPFIQQRQLMALKH